MTIDYGNVTCHLDLLYHLYFKKSYVTVSVNFQTLFVRFVKYKPIKKSKKVVHLIQGDFNLSSKHIVYFFYVNTSAGFSLLTMSLCVYGFVNMFWITRFSPVVNALKILRVLWVVSSSIAWYYWRVASFYIFQTHIRYYIFP